VLVSIPDNKRISSSTLELRFWASSTIRMTFLPAEYCSMRNMFSMSNSSTFFLSKGLKPNSVSADCRNCVAVSCVWETTG